MSLFTHFQESDYIDGCSRCGASYPKYTSTRQPGIFCYRCIDAVNVGCVPTQSQSQSAIYNSSCFSSEECERRNRQWKVLGY